LMPLFSCALFMPCRLRLSLLFHYY
jgi:hypothetical protein